VNKLKDNGISSIRCPGCGDQISHEEFFPDKAATRELNTVSVSCPNEGCKWEGLYRQYFDTHLGECPQERAKCPFDMCNEHVMRKNMDRHTNKCGFRPETCQFCGRDCLANQIEEHYEMCDQFPLKCEEGCGEEIPRGLMKTHMIEDCTKVKRQCRYGQLGCKFEGSGDDMMLHEEKYVQYHLRMVWRKFQEIVNGSKHHNNMKTPKGHIDTSITHIDTRISEMTRQLGDNMTDVQRIKIDSHSRAVATEDAIKKIQVSVRELQEYYTDLAMSIQTLQATSYGPVYIWKVPDLSRRKREAIMGKTLSLYSAPFYTSRHGYKICLRIYLNGDGAGRGSHLSFFLTMMKGEFDPLLPWPFKQTTTLMLLAQDGVTKDISQSFKPDEFSSSFQRPKSEMNVASGCPQFCSLSVLDNPAYVQNDCLYLKCSVNTRGIEHIT
jgi:hypothetical protein